jgi:small subunit ribosomal protein S6
MENTRSYSGLFIIVPEKQESMDDMKKTINTVIGENSGKIVKENMMGKKVLAYPIKKKTEGIYYEVTFDAEPGSIVKMMKQFRINTDILRTLIDKN